MKVTCKIIKIIMNIIQYIFILIGISAIILFIVPRLIGITPFVVLSGSMEKEIKTGSVAYADTRVNVEDIKIGDIIVFKLDKEYVTHRVIAINENNTFTTKGDANKTEDLAPVKFEDFGGKTIFSIPYLGYLLKAIQTRHGIFVLLVVVGINIIYFIFAPNEKEKKKKEKLQKEKMSKEKVEEDIEDKNKKTIKK